jgi:predicted transport protein
MAADFTRYDAHAVQQMDHNIELIRYRRFGHDLLLLELVNVVAGKTGTPTRKGAGKTAKGAKNAGADKTVAEWLTDLTPPLRQLLDSLEGYVLSLGDDVQRKDLKLYIAFKRIRNFATVVLQKDRLVLYVHLHPDRVQMIDGLMRDVRAIGHWGTGDLEIVLRHESDLERAKPIVRQAYEGGAGA